MSGKALGWALEQPVPMSSAKFVLAVLADQTTSDLAFMAAATLSEKTAMDRKTVLASLARLVEWGLIEDTGERRGRTGQIPVYRLLMGEQLFDNAPYSKHPKNGTVPKTGPLEDGAGNSTVFPTKSTVFPTKESQKRDTDRKLTEGYPTHSPRAHEPAAEAEPPQPTSGAMATKAMIEAGLPATRVNPSHPELLAALAAGVTPDELADVVRECVARGTGPPAMVYVIRTAVGRRKTAVHQQETPDADRTTGVPGVQAGHPTVRARSAVGRQLDAIHRLRAREATASGSMDGTELPVGIEDP